MMRRKYLVIMLMFTIVVGLSTIASAEEKAQSDKWEFGAEVYLWGASIGGNTGTGSDLDISFDDLLSNLEMAFMGAVGARKGKWSLMLDAIYLDVKGDDSFAIPVGRGLDINGNGSVELTGWILTPSVGYNLLQKERIRLDVLAGARYLYLKSDAKFDFVTPTPIKKRDTVSDSIWDGIIGIKGHVNLNQNWYLPYYADIGTGSSNFTWQVFGGVGYRFKRLDLIAAYRYMDWNFDSGDAFDDLNLHGPFVGVKFRL
ncbi:MAG: hypothetical protein AB1Z18_05345 [Desulfobacterales bacterium]